MKESVQNLGPTLTPEQIRQAREAFREDGQVAEALPRKEVDPYRATRELERWLFSGQSVDAVIHGDVTPPPVRGNWRETAEVVGTIVYNHNERTVRYEGFGETPKEESEPQAEE